MLEQQRISRFFEVLDSVILRTFRWCVRPIVRNNALS